MASRERSLRPAAPITPTERARLERRVGRQLGSHATQSEAEQNIICGYLSAALLIRLGANALVD